jgi:hypothetical protein
MDYLRRMLVGARALAVRRLGVAVAAILALAALAILPSGVLADRGGPVPPELERAIQEKGLHWTPRAYDQDFSLGLLELPGRELPPKKDGDSQPRLNQLTAIDWRNNGGNYVSSVKNQARCGSCWAFSAVAGLEAELAIAQHTPGTFQDLSEQILVSCESNSYGCNGGYLYYAAQFLRNQGTANESCFPYSASNNNCANACANWLASARRIDSFQTLASQDLNGMRNALANGPVVVAYYVYSDFRNYGGGVYEYATGAREGGHAVLVVGYVDTPGQYGGGYFIVKNSWGSSWGEGGYFRIGYSQVSSPQVRFGLEAYQYHIASGSATPTFTPRPGSPTPTFTPRTPTLTPTPTSTPTPDAFEPDNSSEEAKPIVSGVQQVHSIQPVGDEDWAVFTLAQLSDVIMRTSGPSGGDTLLWLYRQAEGGSLELVGWNDDYNGSDYWSQIGESLPAGTYFIRVTEWGWDHAIALYYLDLTIAGDDSTATPTYTPTFTHTPRPTRTPTFTRTPRPTFTPSPTPGPALFAPPALWLSDLTPSQGEWMNQNWYPRLPADVDGDGKRDLVAFGPKSVSVALSTGTGFSEKMEWLTGFGISQGWINQDRTPRCLADVDGDGKEDIIGFGRQGTFVSLSTGISFTEPALWIANYGASRGWASQDRLPRFVGDVDGDGKGDVVAFGAYGVFVSRSTGSSFEAPSRWSNAFSAYRGWVSQNTLPRFLADVNGDGMADIVAFGVYGAYVSLSTGTNFAAPTLWMRNYGTAIGWRSQNVFPRALGDVDGDGKADIVAFGQSGTYVSFSTGEGFKAPVLGIAAYGPRQGWTSQYLTPRFAADVDGGGRADIVGFGNSGVYVSLCQGD